LALAALALAALALVVFGAYDSYPMAPSRLGIAQFFICSTYSMIPKRSALTNNRTVFCVD